MTATQWAVAVFLSAPALEFEWSVHLIFFPGFQGVTVFAKGLKVAQSGVATICPTGDVIDFPARAQLTEAADAEATC